MRDSIRAHGVQIPIVLTDAGNVVDGHNRLAIATELGIHCPTRTLTAAESAHAEELAVELNRDRRHLTVKDQERLIGAMRSTGASQREIAEELGIGQRTVGRHVPTEPSDSVGTRARPGKGRPLTEAEVAEVRRLRLEGRPIREIAEMIGCGKATVGRVPLGQPRRSYRKISITEGDRLRQIIADARARGYSVISIAEALGLNEGTVTKYKPADRNLGKRAEPAEPLVSLPAWRDEEQPRPQPEPLYRKSTTLALLRSLLAELVSDNAINRLANDMEDATLAGDTAWITGAKALTGDTITYLHQLSAVLNDPRVRLDAQHDPGSRAGIRALMVVEGA